MYHGAGYAEDGVFGFCTIEIKVQGIRNKIKITSRPSPVL
jgi:hypothetical protein